jgi:hypothetical protein
MTLKKITLFACLFFLTLTLAVELKAIPELDLVTPSQLNKEGPLTQADVEVYEKFFAANHEYLEKEKTIARDTYNKLTAKFCADNKISIARLRYVLDKMPLAFLAAKSDLDSFDAFAPFLDVSAAEKDLAKKNMDGLQAIHDDSAAKAKAREEAAAAAAAAADKK